MAACVDFRVSAAGGVPHQAAKRIEGRSEEIQKAPKAFPIGSEVGGVGWALN